VAKIRGAIGRVVDEPRFREGARTLSLAIDADIREHRGVRELECLVTRSEVTRAKARPSEKSASQRNQ
jgi:hypothetical protein